MLRRHQSCDFGDGWTQRRGAELHSGVEIYPYELVSVLDYAAAVTDRIELMTGIIPIYSRSAALIAYTSR